MVLPHWVGLWHCLFQGFTLTSSLKTLNFLALPLQQYPLSWAMYLPRSSCGHLFHWTVPDPWLSECCRDISIRLIGKKSSVRPASISFTELPLVHGFVNVIEISLFGWFTRRSIIFVPRPSPSRPVAFSFSASLSQYFPVHGYPKPEVHRGISIRLIGKEISVACFLRPSISLLFSV